MRYSTNNVGFVKSITCLFSSNTPFEIYRRDFSYEAASFKIKKKKKKKKKTLKNHLF